MGRLYRAGARAQRGVRAVLSTSGLRGTAIELAWAAAHIALYPLGLAGERLMHDDSLNLDHLRPHRRGLVVSDVEAAGTPILLVHGVVDNRSIFTVLRRGLHRRGFGRITSFNYSPLSLDIRNVAVRLAEEVEQLCLETGYERIHLIGHSMGGLVARHYVQCLGGDERVHTLVTLGTPHRGTLAARMLPHPVARQLRPTSDVITELERPTGPCRTRFVAFWSDLDQIIIPQRNARLEHPDLASRNVFVRGVGHLSLPIDGRVVHEISTTLAHLDHDGTTLTAGVTQIDSASSPARRERSAGMRTRKATSAPA